MGMFDHINYQCECPVCHADVVGFQSKDGECALAKLEPSEVDNFYTNCKKCGCWIEFKKIYAPTKYFTRTVEGRGNRGHKLLIEHTKVVAIPARIKGPKLK